MKRLARIAVGAALLSPVVVVVAATPASATVTASASGGVVTVTLIGDEEPTFRCTSGLFTVNNVNTAPSEPCTALTKLQVNGDTGNQYVDASVLDQASFTKHPVLSASLGDGIDSVVDTAQADTIDLGPGDDTLYIEGGSATNVSNAVGTGSNSVYVRGTPGADTITASGTSPIKVATNTPTVDANQSITGPVVYLSLEGEGGNDTINASGLTMASGVDDLSLDGGPGANTLTSTTLTSSFYDLDGTATMTGGPGLDSFWTGGSGDVVHTGPGSGDIVYDYDSLRSGDRTVDGTATGVRYYNYNFNNDTTMRVRPKAGDPTQATLVSSLNRPGIATLGADIGQIVPWSTYSGARPAEHLLDVVSPGAKNVQSSGDTDLNDLADITIPSGTWVVTGNYTTTGFINPDDPAYGTISLSRYGNVMVHNPWTNKNEGFAHRVTRDLVFRFLTTQQRQALRDQLTNGTATRMSVAHDLVYSDEYRGLDVDRVFRRFLKREADPGGRTYWINSIRNGKSLRKFRAQLFGSSEYYAKAGSTTDGFVRSAYADVLGRQPDPSGLNYWVHKIDTGTERGLVANAFLVSSEARRYLVREQFLRFLDRYPITSEQDTWMNTVKTSATGEQDLIVFLASSGSYYDRS